MGKIYLALLLILLTACSRVMTPKGFEDIEVGTPISEVQAKFGYPYEIETVSEGFERYTYIQRTPISPGVVDQVTYILYVCKGRVINKLTRNEENPQNLNIR